MIKNHSNKGCENSSSHSLKSNYSIVSKQRDSKSDLNNLIDNPRKRSLKEYVENLQNKLINKEVTFDENLPFRKVEKNQKSIQQNPFEMSTKRKFIKSKDDLFSKISSSDEISIPLSSISHNKDSSCNHKLSQPKINNYLSFIEKLEEQDRKLLKLNNVYDSGDDKYYNTMNKNWIIELDSKYKSIWDCIVFYLMIYIITILIYRMSFGLNSVFNSLTILEILIELAFIVDFLLNFFIPYRDKHKNLIYDHSKIFIYYLNDWLIFDLVASYPSNLIGITLMTDNIMPSNWFTSNIFKFAKCLKLLNLTKTGKISGIGIFFRNLDIRNDPALKRVVKFSIVTIFLVHISSCFWIYLGLSPQYFNTWIKSNNLLNSNAFEIYIASIYFNFVTVFTIGYGDIIATNTIERIFNIIFLFVGSFLFSFTVSCLSMIFFRSNAKDEEREKKLEELNKYKDLFDMNDKLYNKIRKTINHQTKISHVDKYTVLEDLSNNLKNELHLIMNKKSMNNFIIFDSRPNQFILFLLPLFKPIITSRFDTLFSKGEFVEEVYFVKKGKLSVQLGCEYDNLEVAEIIQNFHFGEILMYTNEQSPYYLKVKSRVSEIYVLKKLDFSRTKIEFDSIINEILSLSYKTVEMIEKRRKVITTLYDESNNLKGVLNKIRKLDYYLLNYDFESLYENNISPIEACDYLHNLEKAEMEAVFNEKDFKLNITQTHTRSSQINETNKFLQRISCYDPNIIMSFYKSDHPENINKLKSYQERNSKFSEREKGNERFIRNGIVISTQNPLKHRKSPLGEDLKFGFIKKSTEGVICSKNILKGNRPSFFQQNFTKNSFTRENKPSLSKTFNEIPLKENFKSRKHEILSENRIDEIHNDLNLIKSKVKDIQRNLINDRKCSSNLKNKNNGLDSPEEKNRVLRKNYYSARLSQTPAFGFGKNRDKSLHLDNIVDEIQLNAMVQMNGNNFMNEIKNFLGLNDVNLNEVKLTRKSTHKLKKILKKLSYLKHS